MYPGRAMTTDDKPAPRVLYMDGLDGDDAPPPTPRFPPFPSLAPIVAGEYRYSGFSMLPRPRWKPTRCRIVTCDEQDASPSTPFCERHGKARRERIRRLAERVQVPDEPVCGLANARRGTVVFGTYYLGDGPDNEEGFAGDFYAREADCALEVRRRNFLAEETAYVVKEFVLR